MWFCEDLENVEKMFEVCHDSGRQAYIKIKDFLIEDQIIENLENENIKIEINYQQQKTNNLDSSAIKEFELKDVNVKKHEFMRP